MKLQDTVQYFLVDRDALPEVYMRVVQAKELLSSGGVKTIHDAVREAGISRSAFYKYKDSVFPFTEKLKGKIVTFYAALRDCPGVLTEMLSLFSGSGCNVLTINQNIPVNGIANISISVRTGGMSLTVQELLARARELPNVISVDVIASE